MSETARSARGDDGSDGPVAGLWERWQSPEGEIIESCTIIVTNANPIMRPIHERVPVILAPEDWDNWLQSDTNNRQVLQGLLRPYSTEAIVAWPVSTLVNTPKNDGVGCLETLS